MAFPTTTFTDPVAAQSALMNKAQENGLSGAVLDGAEAVQNAVLANLLDGLPGTTVLGVTTAANGAGALGTGGLVRSSVVREGGLIITNLLIDLTGLSSSTTDLDIIGQGAEAAFITQITAATNGTIIGGMVACLELPAGGVTDIDVYKATVGTGVFDGAVTSLAGQGAVLTSGGAWALGTVRYISPDSVAANNFLYLAGGAAGTAAAYTAGRLLVTLYGI